MSHFRRFWRFCIKKPLPHSHPSKSAKFQQLHQQEAAAPPRWRSRSAPPTWRGADLLLLAPQVRSGFRRKFWRRCGGSSWGGGFRCAAFGGSLVADFTQMTVKVNSSSGLDDVLRSNEKNQVVKAKRGKTRGAKWKKKRDLEKTRVTIEIPPCLRRVVGPNAHQFITETSYIVKQYCPLNVPNWAAISEDRKKKLMDAVKVNFAFYFFLILLYLQKFVIILLDYSGNVYLPKRCLC
ncbi:uncharacterized protein LOC126661883 [Mercurialis annua]|uniref:uncharacterized protein LOC126661883 n=1 Tax=Mercurialis annua TaxID=3986 RepID=UPI0024AFB9C2|nr:uncharacterized protein LOC126661883 [Mercurialis annua]